MQNMPCPQDQGMFWGTVDTRDSTPVLHRQIGVDIDVCISVAAIDHAAGNARHEIRFVNGKH